jgi:hypothetical protein
MYSVKSDGTLTINRGDCFSIPLFINVGTDSEPIRFDFSVFPNAEIYLGVYYP